MNVIKAVVTGEYEVIGDPCEADCVIGQSFGAAEFGHGRVNKLLARYIIREAFDDTPLLLQNEIADALSTEPRLHDLRIEGKPSTSTGGELDSWEVLRQFREYMDDHNLNRPILVAQAHHVGRLFLQAMKQGMDPIVLAGLPTEFDPDSTQIWTRSAKLWIPRELAGMAYLKAKHKL